MHAALQTIILTISDSPWTELVSERLVALVNWTVPADVFFFFFPVLKHASTKLVLVFFLFVGKATPSVHSLLAYKHAHVTSKLLFSVFRRYVPTISETAANCDVQWPRS